MGIRSQELIESVLYNPGNDYCLKDVDIQILADSYVLSALSKSAFQYLKEQWWLQQRREDISYKDFLTPLFKSYLSSLKFLDRDSEKVPQFKKLSQRAEAFERDVLSEVLLRAQSEQKEFLARSLSFMKELFLREEGDQRGVLQSDGHKGIELYRTFDGLDIIFELNYQLDREMKITQKKERLYEKAGVGVQSGYSTILLALAHLEEHYGLSGKKMVDLGSGYGRVGLVSALYCEEIDFIGYEYVAHRVDVSNRAAKNLELEKSLLFVTQDLSLSDFYIPQADIFYLYDPFTEETYHFILKQIVELSQLQRVIVVTKGNARAWLERISSDNNWSSPVFIDESNLCIFDSEKAK